MSAAAAVRILAGLALAACALHVNADAVAPEVRVAAGRVRGRWISSRPSGRAVAAFEGIPYAAPPVGQLRFKAPVARQPWGGVLVADKPGAVCPQRDHHHSPDSVTGSEDCLFANVYYPKLALPRALPVMVWVHGGGFTNGASHWYGPEYLTDRDVVLVSFNYRLFALGFLSTGDDAVPGNQALKDAVLALQWVRENIHAFGGDADSVTIFGESAGAAAVDLLTLSPLTKGLFHRAIQMSGSALSPWAFYEPARARAKADALAAALGCPTHCSKALRDCLVAKPVEDIVRADVALQRWLNQPLVLFRPTAEPAGPQAFLDKHPGRVYADGGARDVPVLTGVTTHEGALILAAVAENASLLADLDARFEKILSIVLFTDHLSPALNGKQFAQIRRAYLGDRRVGDDAVDELLELFTDAYFGYASWTSARKRAAAGKAPVFFYELGRRSERSLVRILGASAENQHRYGVCHGDDLPYLFPMGVFVPGPSEKDMAFSATMLDLFTTFAATGAPTRDGSWAPVKDLGDNMEFAHLAKPGPVTVRRGFHNERMARWAKLDVNPAVALGSCAPHQL